LQPGDTPIAIDPDKKARIEKGAGNIPGALPGSKSLRIKKVIVPAPVPADLQVAIKGENQKSGSKMEPNTVAGAADRGAALPTLFRFIRSRAHVTPFRRGLTPATDHDGSVELRVFFFLLCHVQRHPFLRIFRNRGERGIVIPHGCHR
jgi:hypothetical protein